MVADFKVGLELLEAWSSRLELGVRNSDLTRTSSWTAPVKQSQHVRVAVDVAEVELDAPAEPHSTVAGSCQQQDLAITTSRTEHLRLTVLAAALSHWRVCTR